MQTFEDNRDAQAEVNMPKRIQRTRMKGSKLPARTLCVTRPSVLSNPFTLKEFGELALPLFRNTLRGVWNPALMENQSDAQVAFAYDLHCNWQARFRGRHPLDVLREAAKKYDFFACWCPLTRDCHVDSLLEALASG